MVEDQFKEKNSPADKGEISLKELILNLQHYWRFLLSKWRIILAAGLVGSLLGFTIAFFQKPIYKAKFTFALEDENSSGGGGLGGALGLASQFGFDLGGSGGGAFAGDNLLELMKSRLIIQKTLLTNISVNGQKRTLAELYIDINHLRDKWKDKSELNSVKFVSKSEPQKLTRVQDSLLGEFHKDLISKYLSVSKLDKKLSIISVNVSSYNEIFAKYFTDVLVNNVANFYVETKTKKSSNNLAVLQHQTDSVRRQLNNAISGVATSVDLNPNPNPSRKVLSVPSQRRQVDVIANQAILTELVKNLEISKVSLRKETPLIQVIDQPIFPLEKQRKSKVVSGIVGGILCGFLAIAWLLLSKIFRNIIN